MGVRGGGGAEKGKADGKGEGRRETRGRRRIKEGGRSTYFLRSAAFPRVPLVVIMI